MQKKINLVKVRLSIYIFLSTISWSSAQTGLSGTINALAVVPDPVPIFYAGTDQGLYSSNNRGSHWTTLGLADQSIGDILIHPLNKDIIFVAAGNNGIMKSANGGKDWDVILSSANIPGMEKDIGDMRSVTIDRSNRSILYAGSLEGYIFKSVDEGKSWTAINPDFPLLALNSLALHPSEDETIYAGLGGRGILKSMDGGTTWTDMNNGLLDRTVTRLIIDPVQPETMYAGTYGEGVFVSADGGQTWTSANTGLSDKFIYSLAIYRDSAGSTESGGFFNMLRQKLSTILEHTPAELYAGVFGGNLFKASSEDEIHWEPVAAK